MSPASGQRPTRTVVSLVEWVLKKVEGPDGWRPAGAVKVLPPSALVFDTRDAARAEAVFQQLALLGFQPVRVPLDSLADDLAGLYRTIVAGAERCWAVVLLEPEDPSRAGKLGPAFREFAHLTPDAVALVVGPLPSRAEILDRFRHAVTASDGSVSSSGLAAGLSLASSARVLHCTHVMNAAALLFALVALVVGLGVSGLAWACLR